MAKRSYERITPMQDHEDDVKMRQNPRKIVRRTIRKEQLDKAIQKSRLIEEIRNITTLLQSA